MKRVFPFFVLLSVCAWMFSASGTASVPDKMFYQAHLTDEEGAPLDTVISMTFTIYDDSTGGVAWWSETQDSVTVVQGLFNVVLGSVNPMNDSAFMNPGRWLGLAIGFDPEITPRTELVTVPWAYRVATVDGASGGMINSGMEVLGNVDASGFSIEGVPVGTSSDSYWSQSGDDIFYASGNVGIGTTTPTQALDVQGNIHASGALISGSSITIDGITDQITATSGRIDFDDEDIITTGKATIGPGHTNSGAYAFVAGQGNEVSGNFATVAGHLNTASALNATVGGGGANTASGHTSTVAGGSDNIAGDFLATVGGGAQNNATDTSATVCGGKFNTAGRRATVGGGEFNEASGEYTTVDGGDRNAALGPVSTVGGGSQDTTYGAYCTIGGGLANVADSNGATVGGGQYNRADHYVSTIGGGSYNNARGEWSTIGGGYADTASGENSAICGGWLNTASGGKSAIGGGEQNLVQGDYSAVLGGYANTITATADYSYLFGIGSSLGDDSTFMVDLPHIFLQGEIWQANSDGDTICELSSFSTGGGFIGTYGSNGNLNTALTILDIGEEDHGGVGVANEDGEWRALMYSDSYYSGDRGVVETYGPNGNINLKLWNALVDENAGCVSVADAAGEYRGHFLVTDDSAGLLTLRGPNDYLNVVLRNVEGDPNAGSMGVCDNDGWMRAEMFVDEYGQGIVAGDQKSFRVPNPNEPGTDIWYCCLEGPEAAAYVRGTGHLVNGRASVTLPDHFTAVASSKGITVQVTPLSGESRGLAVVEKTTDRFAVRELNTGSGTYDFDFMVTAVRKGHEDYQVIRASIETKPVDRGATRDDSPVQLMKTPGR